MKCLFLSVKKWDSSVTHLASRGNQIVHDPMRDEILRILDACVVLITYEENDSFEKLESVVSAIQKESQDLGRNKILIVPFAHLSSKIGDALQAKNFLDAIVRRLIEGDFEATREHFGSDKQVELIVNSHPGCVRFREY